MNLLLNRVQLPLLSIVLSLMLKVKVRMLQNLSKNDPVIVVGQLINSLQTIVSRNLSAFDSAVVTIGEISCGNTWNVIADKAYIQGTVRSFDEDIRHYIENRMKNIADGLRRVLMWILI